VLVAGLVPATALASGTQAHSVHAPPPAWTVVPFVLMLLSIAVIPLIAHRWWESNRNKGIVSAVLGGLMLLYLLAAGPAGSHERLAITLFDYMAFIALLAALFMISGGILLRGSLVGTPLVNTLILLIGAVLASFMGTTGAGMLLIRPLLRANEWRRSPVHVVVFFIFLVTNIGGLLTPLGDPPLFLGFLKRVPFQWTFRLAPEWALAVGLLLFVFYVLDAYKYGREIRQGAKPPTEGKEALRLDGSYNFLFLGGIIATILTAGFIAQNKLVSAWFGIHSHLAVDAIEKTFQSVLMLAIATAAMKVTPARVRKDNAFSWEPIIEVAVLFIGIFITMIPALWILDALGAQNKLGIDEPWQFFWATGILSSFLDNAPTYLTFTAAASGLNHTDPNNLMQLIETTAAQTHLAEPGVAFLKAISVGAVFMGANTYIGNGPNFMVKAIAEVNGVKMPSFFGYMLYSGLILIPLFVVITIVFFA
jgi:Na+/H+ antiporter NhaD/arsenite permease-like protein